LKWPEFYLFYFIYRCSYSVLGQVSVTSFTSLGDSARYQIGGFVLDLSALYTSTFFTVNLGSVIGFFAFKDPILINVGFQALAFYGIYQFLQALDPELRRRAAILLLFPSFNLWTSVAGKEAVVVFALGIACAYMTDMYYLRERIRPLHVISGYILFIFKAHYLSALLFVFLVSKISQHLQKKSFFVLFVGVMSLLPLYVYREAISKVSFSILPHFVGTGGRSTREPFWEERWDVFLKAPEGMLQSFYGPTLGEILKDGAHLLQIVAYFESFILIAVLLYYLIREIPTLPIYNLFVYLFVLFWIMFVNYPFGVMNPGSAIRYRSGYFLLVVMVVVLFTSRRVFIQWRYNVK